MNLNEIMNKYTESNFSALTALDSFTSTLDQGLKDLEDKLTHAVTKEILMKFFKANLDLSSKLRLHLADAMD